MQSKVLYMLPGSSHNSYERNWKMFTKIPFSTGSNLLRHQTVESSYRGPQSSATKTHIVSLSHHIQSVRLLHYATAKGKTINQMEWFQLIKKLYVLLL